jgi:DNA-binding MarR family transcriptional regulator
MIDKLTKKQVVQKTVLSSSDTEVALELTPKGRVVYDAHQEYHRQFYQTVELAMAQVSQSDIRVFGESLNQVAAFLDQEA